VASSKRKRSNSDNAPPSLSRLEVDVTTRLGSLTPATTTGIEILDEILHGGLRSGDHFVISGAPGVGKTALALMLAYMAARSKAAAVFAGVALDDTEIMARLAARALHREYANVEATYGTIWTGHAMQDPVLRPAVTSSLDTVVKKVGNLLHLYDAKPMESTRAVASRAAQLWSRHDRVVVVVDGIEGFAAGGEGDPVATSAANSSYEGRLSQVAYELSSLAKMGCVVVSTCQQMNAGVVAPAATCAGELRPLRHEMVQPRGPEALKRKGVDFIVTKNRTGPTQTIPLAYFAAASVFEVREDA
jgi:replicative DNA helicase